LAHHDSLPVCGERASPEELFERRRQRLLDPENERVSVVARSSITQERVPTLPLPTTLRARSA
jgi:hypothetical protein